MKIVSQSTRPDKKRWAVRFHRVSIQPTAWQTYMTAASQQGSDASSAFAAMQAAAEDALSNIAVQVLNICDSATAFAPRTTTAIAGIAVSIDYPSVGLPCMLAEGSSQMTREYCTRVGSLTRTSLSISTLSDGFAYVTPFTSALTQAIAMKHYQRVAASRTLSASEQAAFADVQQGYQQALAAACSFYAWYPSDFVVISGDFLYTSPGGVLDSSLTTGITGGGAAYVTPSSALKAVYSAARTKGATIADLTANVLQPDADVDDPDAIVDQATFNWARFDASTAVTLSLQATEARELFQTPQSLIGIAHDLVRDAFGDANITLKDYANAIYYMGRAVARVTGKTDKEAQNVQFLIGAGYRDFVDYARAVGILTDCTSSAEVLALAETLRTRQWVVTSQTTGHEAARAAIASCFARRVVSPSALAQAVQATGNAASVSLELTLNAAESKIVAVVKVGGQTIIQASVPQPAVLSSVSVAMLAKAQNFNLHRMARYEFLMAAASASGTNAVAEMKNGSSLTVTSPAVRLIQEKLAGVGLASDEFATPFKL